MSQQMPEGEIRQQARKIVEGKEGFYGDQTKKKRDWTIPDLLTREFVKPLRLLEPLPARGKPGPPAYFFSNGTCG